MESVIVMCDDMNNEGVEVGALVIGKTSSHACWNIITPLVFPTDDDVYRSILRPNVYII